MQISYLELTRGESRSGPPPLYTIPAVFAVTQITGEAGVPTPTIPVPQVMRQVLSARTERDAVPILSLSPTGNNT